ncbi:MAG: TlyA family RNA methyltransferase [Flexilinea sp.]
MIKKRLDILLQEKGLVESRSLAQKLIMAGQVRVNGNMVIKPSSTFSEQEEITVDHGPQFVSRGGEKLLEALTSFGMLDLKGFICADVGSSTGGFTDCLLQHGAEKIYAIDVGYGLLHWKIRNNPGVISMEKTNARDVNTLPERIDLVTVDASFISLKLLLPVIKNWYGGETGSLITLIKPQFEAGKEEAARGAGVIRDPLVHRKVLSAVLTAANQMDYETKGLIRSPLLGPKGNIEFLARFEYPGKNVDIESFVRQLL